MSVLWHSSGGTGGEDRRCAPDIIPDAAHVLPFVVGFALQRVLDLKAASGQKFCQQGVWEAPRDGDGAEDFGQVGEPRELDKAP